MFCTNCGAQLREGTNFCTNCGAKVVTASAAAESAKQAAAAEVNAAEKAARQAEEAAKKQAEEAARQAEEAAKKQAEEAARQAEEAAKKQAEEAARQAEEAARQAAAAAPAPEVAPTASPAPAATPAPEVIPVAAAATATAASATAAPAAAPAVTKAAAAPYNGPSIMQSFRVLYGVLALLYGVTLIATQATSFIAIDLRYINPEFFLRFFQTLIPGLLFLSFLPGIMSLILSKPTRIKSIILAAVLSLIWIVELIIGFVQLTRGQITPVSFFFSVPILSLFFAFLMALISIFQPKSLVKEPGKTVAKGWKIASGIFHIIGGVIVLIFAIALLVIWLVENSNAGAIRAVAPAFISILVLGIYMLVCGCVSAGAKKTSAASLTYLSMIAFVRLVGTASTCLTRFPALGEASDIVGRILGVFSIILAIWYFIGFVIAFITMFLQKKA